MAEGKKGFMLYADQKELFDELSDEYAGKLIKHIMAYVNDESPQTNDDLVKISFIPIKQHLKRDLKKYEDTCNKNRENALIRWNKKNATASDRMPTDAKNADKEKDIDNDKVIDIKKSLLSELKKSDFDNSTYFEITTSFFELFKLNLESAGVSTVKIKKSKGTWIDSIRLLIEQDKYTIEDLRDVFKFLQTNDFWKRNILSTTKLREKMETLLIQARENGENKQGNGKGCTNEELAEVIGKHFAIDKKE